MRRMRRLHITGQSRRDRHLLRCLTTIPHPILVAGSLLLHGKWVRRRSRGGKDELRPEAAEKFLTPPRKDMAVGTTELVQIGKPGQAGKPTPD